MKTSAEKLEPFKVKLLMELSTHIGELNAIGMAVLYEKVFGAEWSNKINDTRRIRTLITIMRREGIPICSVSAQNGGGYYLASAGSELISYLSRSERRALNILARNARIKRISLPEYLGQMKLNMEGSGNAEN
jgi:hypothetical protein